MIHPHSAHKGSALITVMCTVALVSGLLGILFSLTTSQARLARRNVDRAEAVAYADGLMENLFDQWRARLSAATNDDRRFGPTTTYLRKGAPNGIVSPAATLPPPPGIQYVAENDMVVASDPYGVPVAATARPVMERPKAQSSRERISYRAKVRVKFDGLGPEDMLTVDVERVFVRTGRSMLDNFFFGLQVKTEFHPGAPLYVDGPCFVGGDLFTAHDNLHFLQDVTITGQHYLDYRPEDSRRAIDKADPDIDNLPSGTANNWVTAPVVGDSQKLLDTPSQDLDGVFFDDPIANDFDTDGNPNNDGFHELLEKVGDPAKPDPLRIDSELNDRFYAKADFKVEVDAANNLVIYKGTSTTPLPQASGEGLVIKDALVLNTGLQDAREGEVVRVVSLDVGKVKAAKAAGTLTEPAGPTDPAPDGLLIYISDSSGAVDVPTTVYAGTTIGTGAGVVRRSPRLRGVRLHNGASLPAGGLTVASPHTVYIQGDYNTGRTATQQPPSNTTSQYTPPVDKPSPVIVDAANKPLYDRQPAAVAGDAVNILSNAWNDGNSLLAKSSRVAANTTVNTVIVAGNVPTLANSYSGGIENFVRLHENWSGKYVTIHGSMAQLYASKEAKGPWKLASYDAPNRRWYYETMLRDRNPPGFPPVRSYERGTRMVRNVKTP